MYSGKNSFGSSRPRATYRSFDRSQFGQKSYTYILLTIIITVAVAYIFYLVYKTNQIYDGKSLNFTDTLKNIIGMYVPPKPIPEPIPEPVSTRPPPPAKKKEVFNIDQNIFTYTDAIAVCKAYDSELATEAQIKSAANNKAHWCNYGWSKGDGITAPAYFITQKSHYDNLQKGPIHLRESCGKPGVNGGQIDVLDVKLGANCYGIKPQPDASKITYRAPGESAPASSNVSPGKESVKKYKDLIARGNIEVRPFNKNKWSLNDIRFSSYKLKSDGDKVSIARAIEIERQRLLAQAAAKEKAEITNVL